MDPVAWSDLPPQSIIPRFVYEIAQAADLEEQLGVLLQFAADYMGASRGLATHVDRVTMRLEIVSVVGDPKVGVKGAVLEPGSPEWKSLLSDGVVRRDFLFSGSAIAANLFVPTADPTVPQGVVHLEWQDPKEPNLGALETLLSAFRAVANLLGNAEKTRSYDHLRHSPAVQDESNGDLDLDEPRLELLLGKAVDRIAKMIPGGNVAISLKDHGEDALSLLPSAYRGNLALDPRSLPRLIRRRRPTGQTWTPERRRFPSANGLSFAALDLRKTYLAQFPGCDPHYTPFFKGTGPAVAIPLVLGEEMLGVVLVEGGSGIRFTAEEFMAIEKFARDLALFVIKAKAYEGSKSRNPREAVLLVGLPRRALEQAFIAAPVESTLFVEGESGVGKEMFARFVHYLGPRREKPFITLDCASLTPTLIESQLFGHLKGAFTGAEKDAIGLFLEAEDGTVFIDEVHNLSWDLQGKLLRVLERRTVKPLGAGAKEQIVRARVVVATNEDLRGLVEQRSFRKDLYYRLDVLRVRIPSLREMKAAIPRIAQVLIEEVAELNHKKAVPLTPVASRMLCDFAFRGNIRELRNMMERAVVFDHDGKIDMDDLPPEISDAIQQRLGTIQVSTVRVLGQEKGAISRELLVEVLKAYGGNVTDASKKLRVGRRHLYKLFKRYEVNPDDFRNGT